MEHLFILVQVRLQIVYLFERGDDVSIQDLSVCHPSFVPEVLLPLFLCTAERRRRQIVQGLFELEQLLRAVELEEVLVGVVEHLQAVADGDVRLYELLQVAGELLLVLLNVCLDQLRVLSKLLNGFVSELPLLYVDISEVLGHSCILLLLQLEEFLIDHVLDGLSFLLGQSPSLDVVPWSYICMVSDKLQLRYRPLVTVHEGHVVQH